MSVIIPKELLQDPYWRGMLYIFRNHSKLQRYLKQEYIDFKERTVHGANLKKIARPWSLSEKFMLDLALHLFNDMFDVNLSDMDCLDPVNKEIAIKAIRLRFSA